jgi:hypothetical protein
MIDMEDLILGCRYGWDPEYRDLRSSMFTPNRSQLVRGDIDQKPRGIEKSDIGSG